MEPQLRAMGRRLREARLAREINPRALQTELRTTYRHLLAIEEGQTRLFYSESFYRDLFERYATALGFSIDEAREMIARMQTPVPPLGSQPAQPPVSASAPSDIASAANTTADATTAAVSEVHAPGSTPSLFGDTAPPDTLAPAHSQPSAAPSQAAQPVSGGFMSGTASKIFFIALIGLVLLFWLVSQETEPESAVVPAPAPVENSAPAEAPPGPPTLTPGPAAPEQPVAVAAQPVAAPAQQAAAPAQPVAEPGAPAEPDRPAELELTFRTKGWVWVREANDSVREFVVPEGGTVRFREMPIFIVLPAPDQIDVKVLGKPVSLKRTEDEKNHGRFTRTMLRQAANLGRPPLSSSN